MSNLFSSLNITSNALSVNESAISVVSHNVANMNTEGYHKQKVHLATRNIAGIIGDSVQAQVRANGGVKIADVMRYNDEYLTNYYRTQLSKLSEYEQQLGNLGDLADVFNDLDDEGISGALKDFYKAVNNLNEYPASSTARVNFIETSKTLCSVLNSKNQLLDNLTTKALGDGETQDSLENSEIYSKFTVFNDKLEELAEINRALQVTQTGTLEANNLLDKRDLILNDIAEFVDIKVVEKRNGSVNLFVGDTPLVKGAKVTGKLEIQTAKAYCEAQNPPINYPDDWVTADGKPREAAVISIAGEYSVSNANSIIKGGSLGGLLHSADIDADGMNVGKAKEGLNKLAQSIASIFNQLNTREGAYCINSEDVTVLKATDPNDPKYLIFTGENGKAITAGTINVNPDLLVDGGCWNIACAYFENGENFDERAIGNALNVVDMLGTRSMKMDGQDGRPDLNGMTLEDYYTGLIGKIAAGGSSAQTLYDTQDALVDSLYNQLGNATNVDLNEELVDLVKYQTAYAAAAQVFNVCNNCLDTLMRLGG